MAKKMTKLDEAIAALGNEFTGSALDLLAATCAAQKVAIATARLNEKRNGVYATFTWTAATVSAKEFASSLEKVEKLIRENRGDIAAMLGCKRSKKNPDEFVMPSSVMTAKSTLLRALEFDVPLLDEEGAPRAYGKIRDDVSAILAAQEAAKAEAANPALVARRIALEALEELREAIESREPDATMAHWLNEAATMMAALKGEYVSLAGDEPQDDATDTGSNSDAEAA